MSKGKNHRKGTKIVKDKHLLYSAAVQSTDADIDFFKRVYKRRRGEKFEFFREDFCGTAALACDWVSRNKKNRAIAIDLDEPTLEYGRRRYLPKLGEAADRVELICKNVLDVTEPKVDVIAAQNFSFCVFKSRELLGRYFRTARESLRPGGILFTDILGGTEAMDEMKEKRKIPASKAFDGTKVPAFTYVWEQASFNPVDHDFKCNIHFRLSDGTKMKNAFRYDWRLWTLPEIQELMLEAGFASTEVYVEGWDEDADDTDGIFRRRKKFENQNAWVAYVVGLA